MEQLIALYEGGEVVFRCCPDSVTSMEQINLDNDVILLSVCSCVLFEAFAYERFLHIQFIAANT